MDISTIQEKFSCIGARVKLASDSPPRWGPVQTRLRLDIGADRRGEFFELRSSGAMHADLSVIDLRPRTRHVLLLVREQNEKKFAPQSQANE